MSVQEIFAYFPSHILTTLTNDFHEKFVFILVFDAWILYEDSVKSNASFKRSSIRIISSVQDDLLFVIHIYSQKCCRPRRTMASKFKLKSQIFYAFNNLSPLYSVLLFTPQFLIPAFLTSRVADSNYFFFRSVI